MEQDISATMDSRPPCVLPVRSRKKPMTIGATKPPRMPQVLMNAILPAAALPPKCWLGTAQKTVYAPHTPATAQHRAIKETRKVVEVKAATTRPIEAIAAGTIACQVRSPWRSELRVSRIITGMVMA